MRHLSAHKAEQEAVQAAYEQGAQDALTAVLVWLTERMAQREFAVVETAFRSDWIAPAVATERAEVAQRG